MVAAQIAQTTAAIQTVANVIPHAQAAMQTTVAVAQTTVQKKMMTATVTKH